MKHRSLEVAGAALFIAVACHVSATAQGSAPHAKGPYARIAIMRPLDGHFVDFEAAYIRHLAWHEEAKDSWTWYGWTIDYSERRMWFVYASFGHSAAEMDNPVDPAGDNRDNIMNVAPHVDHWGNALYEFLPHMSRGSGIPTPTARLELTTVDLNPGGESRFEAALGTVQPALQDETLWYRMIVGGTAPKYIRLRPRQGLAATIDGRNEQALPDGATPLVAKTAVEVLTLRPTMSYGLSSANEAKRP
jgi:hypothetical protein